MTEEPDDSPGAVEGAPEPEPANGRWRIVCLVPADGQEPQPGLSDAMAEATWASVSSAWHPALLTESSELPRFEDLDAPGHPAPDEVRILPAPYRDRLPSGYATQAADAGTVLVETTADRSESVRMIAGRMGVEMPDGGDEAVARDFLALGTARWWLRDLTIAMGHVDCLDVTSLTREVLGGARNWRDGDPVGATNRLRAGFELLTQARERFYPVDAYLVDVCLLDLSPAAGALDDLLAAKVPVTLLAPARAVEVLAARNPEAMAALRLAIDEGWADVVGGAYGEADEPLRPLESILWQFRKAAETYRRHLDDRTTETLARRRFGLYPQLPQIARRFGFRFAVHGALDSGRFPTPPESKRMWDAPDGTQLESLCRSPIAADRAIEGLNLPWHIGRTMRDDHVATVVLAHWPEPVAGWLRDLRRVAAYSPVLSRLVTLGDYFHQTDRPYEGLRPELDRYVTPYLEQAVARRETSPIGRRVVQTALRAKLDGLSTLGAEARAAGAEVASWEEWGQAEDALESGRLDEAAERIGRIGPGWVESVCRHVSATATAPRPGYLVLNPLGVARRASVLLADAAADLRPEGPLLAAQFTDEGVWAVVDLPAFGYAWIPRETSPTADPSPAGAIGVKGRMLFNQALEVVIDERTGGVKSIRRPGEPYARLGQQLVIVEPRSGGEAPPASRMQADRFEVDYGGPALVQAWSEGVVLEPDGDRPLARFRQRFRMWAHRPGLELDIELSDLDTLWVDRLGIAAADPWVRYLACRWAWPDPEASLRRSSLLSPEPTTAERPETPDVLDISTRRERTAMLFGGLAHHLRHGPRMLDTLLISGRERARAFRLGVVLDQEYPHQSVQDFLTPALVAETDAGPPGPGSSGWFFHLDGRGVAVTRVEPVMPSGEDRGGVVFHLLETTGRAARCRLRLVRPPLGARQVDFLGEPIVDLTIDGDAVHVDLTPHELARVEIRLD